MNAFSDLERELQRRYPALSPRLKTAARYALDMPDDIALLPLRRVAARAGVAPATLVRLARALDFPSYSAFRNVFAQRLRGGPGRYGGSARALQARETMQAGNGADMSVPGGVLDELFAMDKGNLDRTLAENPPMLFSAAARRLMAARRVYVVGRRKCFPVASYFHYAARMCRGDVFLAQGIGGMVMDDLVEIGTGDVLLAVGFEPYTRETVMAVQYARVRGAGLVVITDSPVSPLAAEGGDVFTVANASPSFFRSITGAMAIAQALVALMVARGGNDVVARIEQMEKNLDGFEAYWMEKS